MVSKVKVDGVKCIKIVADKSIFNGCVYTINKIQCGLAIPKSIWSNIHTFNIGFKVVAVNNEHYTCPALFTYAIPIMRQKHTKHKSIYTEKFIKTVTCLSNTKVYICKKMLEKTKTLIDLEYQKLVNEEGVILKHFNDTFKKYNEYKLVVGLEPNEL